MKCRALPMLNVKCNSAKLRHDMRWCRMSLKVSFHFQSINHKIEYKVTGKNSELNRQWWKKLNYILFNQIDVKSKYLQRNQCYKVRVEKNNYAKAIEHWHLDAF